MYTLLAHGASHLRAVSGQRADTYTRLRVSASIVDKRRMELPRLVVTVQLEESPAPSPRSVAWELPRGLCSSHRCVDPPTRLS